MKHKTLLISFLVLIAVTAGCDKQPTTSQQIDQLQTDTKKASEDLKDYTFAQKAEYTEAMRRQLAEINRDLDELSAKIENSSDAVKAEAKPRLQTLRDQAARLNTQLDEAKDATESTWDSVKAGSKKAYGELKDDFTEARRWVREKIAP